MKGIILAGGTGSRLYPLTEVCNKQLLPVYDKPMIYYPLTTLIENRIKNICIISSKESLGKFEQLLGSGSRFGIKINYKIQDNPNGIPEAFLIAKDFIGKGNVSLILGDNIFSGAGSFRKAFKEFKSGGTIFAYEVIDPREYGVVLFDKDTKKALSLEEKPKEPKSKYAVPGLYIYDSSVVSVSENLKPSQRGELEITDVNRYYMNSGNLKVYKMSRGCAWLDAGSSSTLQDSSLYVQTVEKRQGVKLGCPEEEALYNKFITREKLLTIINDMPECEYKNYLSGLC